LRIIDSRHDYYDGVQKQGQDRTLIFNRKFEDEIFGIKELSIPLFHNCYITIKMRNNLNIDEFFIIFCGKYYRGIRLSFSFMIENYKMVEVHPKTLISFHYTKESFLKKLESYNIKEEKIKELFIHWKWLEKISFRRKEDSYDTILDNIFLENGSEKYKRYVVENKIPILLGEPPISRLDRSINGIFTKNPMLKDYEFFKVMDAQTAFQELSMFIGGVLPRTENPIVNISDKDMLIKKGFDKWSFRKMSEGKKRKKDK